jgi:hypothetical protein
MSKYLFLDKIWNDFEENCFPKDNITLNPD